MAATAPDCLSYGYREALHGRWLGLEPDPRDLMRPFDPRYLVIAFCDLRGDPPNYLNRNFRVIVERMPQPSGPFLPTKG
jgi:hypothetical protein